MRDAAAALVLLVVGGCAERSAPSPAAAIAFVGSSTIARFPLSEAFPGKPCLNLGRGNETAPELARRLATLRRDLAAARAVVLYAGSSDHRFAPELRAEELAARVAAVVDEIARIAPNAPILMIEVLPAMRQTEDERRALRAVNRELEALAAARGASFLRTHRAPLCDAAGDLSDTVAVDRHHLNETGYRALAAFLRADPGPVGALLR